MDMIHRAASLAEQLSNDCISDETFSAELNDSFSTKLMHPPTAERGKNLVITERGGRILATQRAKPVVEEHQSMSADKIQVPDHASNRRSP